MKIKELDSKKASKILKRSLNNGDLEVDLYGFISKRHCYLKLI